MKIKPVPKVEADLTRREKVMVTNVRSFIETEALRFTASIKRETDGYVAELMERVLNNQHTPVREQVLRFSGWPFKRRNS